MRRGFRPPPAVVLGTSGSRSYVILGMKQVVLCLMLMLLAAVAFVARYGGQAVSVAEAVVDQTLLAAQPEARPVSEGAFRFVGQESREPDADEQIGTTL
jgi:hypothetical protein